MEDAMPILGLSMGRQARDDNLEHVTHTEHQNALMLVA